MEAWVELASSLDVADWARRHARGEVPDRFPYGLDRLAAHDIRVRCRPPLRTRSGELAARAVRRLGGYQWLEAASAKVPRDVDVLACWDERAAVPAAHLDRRRAPLATGVIWLTEPTRRRSVTDLIATAALRRAAAVWALSSAQLPVLRDVWRVPASRLHHLPFGIDADFFASSTATQPWPGLVVSVGNDRHRDYATLLRGLAEARRHEPSLRFELVTRQSIDVPADIGRRHAARTHPEIRELYARASVVAVATSRNLHVSGISVVLEAMAMGRPVVVSDTPGMRDYVDAGITGLLVPPGDPAAFGYAVRSLLADETAVTAMGAAARRSVEERFSTDRQAAHLARILAAAC